MDAAHKKISIPKFSLLSGPIVVRGSTVLRVVAVGQFPPFLLVYAAEVRRGI